jgi:hypothetical protein
LVSFRRPAVSVLFILFHFILFYFHFLLIIFCLLHFVVQIFGLTDCRSCADFNLNALSEKRVSVFVRLLDVTSRAGYTGDSYAKVHIIGLSHSKQLSKGQSVDAVTKRYDMV